MTYPRYPGDADPTNLELAEERRLIETFYPMLGPKGKKAILSLLDQGYVDRILPFTIFDDEYDPPMETTYVLFRTNDLCLLIPFRSRMGNWGWSYGLGFPIIGELSPGSPLIRRLIRHDSVHNAVVDFRKRTGR